MSYRRDAVQKDYLNKFYEQYLHPETVVTPGEIAKQGIDNEIVKMEREYLRAWYIFKNELHKITPHFEGLLH